MKKIEFLAGVALFAFQSVFAAGTVPVVANVVMRQNHLNCKVTISYSLSNASAVVTADIQTNSPSGWLSIGAANLMRFSGDINRVVPVGDGHVVTWAPLEEAWTNAVSTIPAGGVRAVLTAWALEDPPPYMVTYLDSSVPEDDRIQFFASADALPDGGLTNDVYRTTRLVMKKIPARGVTWLMGATSLQKGVSSTALDAVLDGGYKTEDAHFVTFTNNYYLGVYEFTQAQWKMFLGNYGNAYYSVERDMRPMENVSYFAARENDCSISTNAVSGGAEYDYPQGPHPQSLMGRLRTHVLNHAAFDLPSEAQWEFACRGGYPSGYYGDGRRMFNRLSAPLFYDSDRVYGYNAPSGTVQAASLAPAEGGTQIVGVNTVTNGYGLYNMHGNVSEWCLDWCASNVAALDGAVNTTALTNGTVCLGDRVKRGGNYLNACTFARPSYRNLANPGSSRPNSGLRVCCPCGASIE
jgi:formylglycine-generating enzyme required for sulfatase activity